MPPSKTSPLPYGRCSRVGDQQRGGRSFLRIALVLTAVAVAFVAGNNTPPISSIAVVTTEVKQHRLEGRGVENPKGLSQTQSATAGRRDPEIRRKIIQRFADKRSFDTGPLIDFCVWVDSSTVEELIDCLEESANGTKMEKWPQMAFDSIIFEKIGRVDPTSGLEMVQGMTGPRFANSYQALMQSWGNSEPFEAAKSLIARVNADQELDTETFSKIFRLLSLKSSSDLGPLLRDVYLSPKAKGKEYVSKFQNDFIYHQFSDGEDELVLPAWIDKNTFSEENRQEMYRNMIRQCSTFGREDAVIYAVRAAGSNIDAADVGGALAVVANNDFGEAIQYVNTLPPGQLREGAITGISTSHELAKNGELFVELVSGMGSSPVIDAALNRAADSLMESNLPLAWKASNLISLNTPEVGNQRNKIANKWLTEDFETASRVLPQDKVERFKKARPLMKQLGDLLGTSKAVQLSWD